MKTRTIDVNRDSLQELFNNDKQTFDFIFNEMRMIKDNTFAQFRPGDEVTFNDQYYIYIIRTAK